MNRRELIASSVAGTVFGVSGTGASAAVAQATPTTAPGSDIRTLVPPGFDWDTGGNVRAYTTYAYLMGVTNTAFVEACNATCLGDQGARIAMILFRRPPDTVESSWQEAADWFDWAVAQKISIPSSERRDRALDERDPPSAVARARRRDGYDYWTGQEVAVGLYDIAPDIIALVIVEGFAPVSITHYANNAACDAIAEIIALRRQQAD